MAIKIKVVVFWVMTSCGDMIRHHHFRGPCCLQLYCVI